MRSHVVIGLEDPIRDNFDKKSPNTQTKTVNQVKKNNGTITINNIQEMKDVPFADKKGTDLVSINFVRQQLANQKNGKGQFRGKTDTKQNSQSHGKGGSGNKKSDKGSNRHGKGKGRGKGRGGKNGKGNAPIAKCYVCSGTNHRWFDCNKFDPKAQCKDCGGRGHPPEACSNRTFSRNKNEK